MSLQQAPYGTWNSPITAEVITKGANSISEIIVDRVTSEVYHLETRPSEKGRSVLVHTNSNRDIVGPNWNVRTGVHEYGGAPAIVHDGVAYFSHYVDGRVYRVGVEDDSQPVPITPDNKPYRYASLDQHPTHPELLISILEDHTIDIPSEIVTTLVVINSATKTVEPLVSGADFYALAKFSPAGDKLAWIQWFHPDMPWEGGELHVADVVFSGDKTISIKNSKRVAGERGRISASYPAWANNDTLIFTTDESGYVNPWKFVRNTASPLFSTPIEEGFGQPLWILNFFPYVILGDRGEIVLFKASKDGRDVLYLFDLEKDSRPTPLPNPFVVIDNIRVVSAKNKVFVFTGEKTNEKNSVIQCSISSLLDAEFLPLTASSSGEGDTPLSPRLVSEPQPFTLKAPPEGDPLHVVYYPPWNPNYSGSSIDGEKPPCIVNVHGGPTGLTEQGLRWSKQYFTSRGWAWLDVNYGGSSGYGRRYVERLNGKWGIVDVQDCTLAPQILASAPYNLIDSKRLIIRGGSAGGFTVLAALSIAKDVTTFAAATSLYGVSDLGKLAEFTHKFESRYLDHLVGGTVEEAPNLYKERSPIYHAERIVTPLLILQGEIDMVVPKGQAEAIYESIQSRGGVVEYKLYPGEGHGWRQEDNMRDALERELGFYERIFNLKK
ncbi:Dipeptidyl peptidase family member 6 [Psilocybe cubensis]|uniref:Dipeptidyl peptidase family member 6 n=2 Tax=Psilocybe cubensis TaxID=181762 RepID=A0ACB8GIW9_PSICU|nr:Dipeptidyl peptidase family member 6 [Psilocybe cubensis]KAH9475568.1 Dipeptidyl peptidase family member 6 [Psilocybe cubensis]